MQRKEFIRSLLAFTTMASLSSFKKYTDVLPVEGKKMPVLFTSHGNPFDIVKTKEEREFWNTLYKLGKRLQSQFEIKAALVVSAHWCTNRETKVNVSATQKQIYDYYGFPDEYYDVKYSAKGAPDIAKEITKIIPNIEATTDWGLDHGAWPMLMHLFPKGDVPVFQMSINYSAAPSYHYELGKQLKSLREKGVLIIGSGSMIHNLRLAMQKVRQNDMSVYGWETEYDHWLKKQIESRNFKDLINYTTSHKYGKLASPTPDHYVPVLYSLGLVEDKDEISFFYDEDMSLPAFSERSFLINQV